MDALTLLQQYLDIRAILTHYEFEKVREDGRFARSCCKLHGGDNSSSFVINVETGLWYCHTSCGGGDVYTLVQKMEDIEFKQAVRWVAEFFHVDIANLQITERKASHVAEMKRWIEAMKSRKKKPLNEFTIDATIREVTKFRDFQESTLRHFSLGYVERVRLQKRDGGEFALSNRLVFPIIQDGIQVGISFRRINSNDMPKWLHQPANIETKELLYNYDNVQGQREIVVVEGIPDVWAYHEIGVPAVATFGAHLTEQQYKLLMRTGADITLSYDGDEAGRIATQKATNMLRNKAAIKVVPFNTGEDPENISREELKKRYDNKKRI